AARGRSPAGEGPRPRRRRSISRSSARTSRVSSQSKSLKVALATIARCCRPQNNFYRAFTDPSGGSDDSFARAISQRSEDRFIIDAIREAPPPFSPDAVIDDFAVLLKS